MESQAEFECSLGRVHWSWFRDLVREACFHGHKVDMFEGSGWFSRRFIVKGDVQAIRALHAAIDHVSRQQEQQA